jgi:hypothetical protein
MSYSKELSEDELEKQIIQIRELCMIPQRSSADIIVEIAKSVKEDLGTPGNSISRSPVVKEMVAEAFLTGPFHALLMATEVQHFLLLYLLHDEGCSKRHFELIINNVSYSDSIKTEWLELVDMLLDISKDSHSPKIREDVSKFWQVHTDQEDIEEHLVARALEKTDRTEPALFALSHQVLQSSAISDRADEFVPLLDDFQAPTLLFLACCTETGDVDDDIVKQLYDRAVGAISSADKMLRTIGMMIIERIMIDRRYEDEQKLVEYNRLAEIAKKIMRDVILENDTEFMNRFFNMYHTIPLFREGTRIKTPHQMITVPYLFFIDGIVEEAKILEREGKDTMMKVLVDIFTLLQGEYATMHNIENVSEELSMWSVFVALNSFIMTVKADYADQLPQFVNYALTVIEKYITDQPDEKEFSFDIYRCIIVDYCSLLWTIAIELPRDFSMRLVFRGEPGNRFKKFVDACFTASEEKPSLLNTLAIGCMKMAEHQRYDCLFPPGTDNEVITQFVIQTALPKQVRTLATSMMSTIIQPQQDSLYNHAITNSLCCIGDIFVYYVAPRQDLLAEFERLHLETVVNLVKNRGPVIDEMGMVKYAVLLLRLGVFFPGSVLELFKDGYTWISTSLMLDDTMDERETFDGVSGLTYLTELCLADGYTDVQSFILCYDRLLMIVPKLKVELKRTLMKCLIALGDNE